MSIQELRVMMFFHFLLVINRHSISVPWLATNSYLMVHIKAGVVVDRVLMQVLLFMMSNQGVVINRNTVDESSKEGLMSNDGLIIGRVLVHVDMSW